MQYRQLGNTGIRVSSIGFGAWAIGGPVDLFGMPVGWSNVRDDESEKAIQRALELGVNFFDTADVYGSGHSEEILGRWLQNQDCVIATKVGNAREEGKAYKDFSESHIRKSLEKSLKRLHRDFVDLYQLHNPPPNVWQEEEVFELLAELKREGKIRASGVSISRMEEGIHLVKHRKVDVLQVLFNVLNQEPSRELFPLAEKYGVGIIVRVPLASGLLTGKYAVDSAFDQDDVRKNYLTRERMRETSEKVDRIQYLIRDTGYSLTQVALAFVLKHAAVSAPIPGAKRAGQVEQNVSAAEIELDDNLFDTLRSEFASFNFFLRHKIKI